MQYKTFELLSDTHEKEIKNCFIVPAIPFQTPTTHKIKKLLRQAISDAITSPYLKGTAQFHIQMDGAINQTVIAVLKSCQTCAKNHALHLSILSGKAYVPTDISCKEERRIIEINIVRDLLFSEGNAKEAKSVFHYLADLYPISIFSYIYRSQALILIADENQCNSPHYPAAIFPDKKILLIRLPYQKADRWKGI